ncbi:MAG: oligosaccharide flippase family protein [Myxococcota bacterium]|nr:oligosaccharide flippase family protein [Myxococcota bacterium]
MSEAENPPPPPSVPPSVPPAVPGAGPEPAPERPSNADLGGRARRGAMWSMLGYGGGRLLALISNPLISYLIVPAVRGMMELVNPFVLGFELLSDIGIGPSIIQNKRGGDQDFADVAWTIQVTRGVLLWIAVCIGSVPYAWLTGHDELAYILPIAGLTAIAGGLTSSKVYTASRNLALHELTKVELISQAVGFVVKIVWAWLSPTVWSLVMGGLSVLVTKMILSHVLLPGPRNRLRWDPAVARELVNFGRWVFVSTLLTFLTGYADRWIFSTMIPLTVLGLYGNAVVLASLPMEALSHLAHQVVFPLYSRVVQSGQDLAPVFRRARLPLQMIGGWALCGLIAGGPTGIRLLWEESWWGSGWMIQILAAASWFLVCESTNGAAMFAKGEPRWVAAGSFAKLIGMIVLIPVGYWVAEFPGALVAYAGTELFRYGISLWGVSRLGLDAKKQDFGLTLMVGVVGVAVWQLAEHLRAWGVPVAAEAAIVAGAVTLAWAPVARGPIKQFLDERRARQAAHVG